MKRFKYLLFSSFILTCLSSCVISYMPNDLNTPMLEGKGDVDLNANLAFSGLNVSTAIGMTDHIGLIFNGAYSKSEFEIFDGPYLQKMIEMGVGYYTPIREQVMLEIYTGGGIGQIQGNYFQKPWDNFMLQNFNRYFIQPSIGFTPIEGLLEFSIANRFTFVQLFVNNLVVNDFTSDFAFTLKFGSEYVKFVSQYGFSLPIRETKNSFVSGQAMMSVGLQLEISTIIKERRIK